MIVSDLPAKVAAAIRVDPDTGCWIWTGGTRGAPDSSYARMWWNKRDWAAHRLVYSLLVRDLSEWEHLDHTCRIKLCVSPDHLEIVSAAENVRRMGRARWKDRCGKGHLLTPENTYVYVYGGHTLRQCVTCQQARVARNKIRRRMTANQTGLF